MSGWIGSIIGPVAFRAGRRIGDFTNFMTVEETGEDELEITEHPVQQGAEITDHAYKKNPTLSITMSFGANLITPLDETYRAMLKLQESRIPFQVITGKRVYENMLFKSLRCTTDRNTENVLSIQASLKQIKITQVVTTVVPARAKQSSPGVTGSTERAGTKKPQEVKPQDQQTKQSALKKVAGLL